MEDSAQKSWAKILDYIKDQVSAANFRTWFSQASLESLTDTTLTITIPSAFIKGQLISRYEELLKNAAQEILGKEIQIAYNIDSSRASKKHPVEEEPELFTFSNPSPQPISILNPKYTLENFVVGLTNNLAYAAAQAVVQNPGTTYNPLFIYGPSGVGKTHLMQAIGNALLKQNPYGKLMLASSEKFMNDFVESIQNKRTGDFRQKYRNIQVLLIDDIQFISGKDSTQEEFFHTFNELQGRNAQVVLTADRPPHEIQKLEPRLQSRFQGGLMVDIQLPDFDTRIAILKAKLNEKGESLPEEIITMIAETVISNTRELEGKLIQILQMSKHNQAQPLTEVAQRILGKPTTPSHIPDYKKVLSEVNQYFNIKMNDLTGPRRQKELVLPRQLVMFILYEDCKIPMERIGQILGGRDHTTILHGIEKIRTAAITDAEVQRLLSELKQHFNN